MKTKIKYIVLLILCLFIFTSCSDDVKENPIVTMDIKDYGTIKIELYPNIAYNTVANFVNLIEQGYYDNNTFHRLDKNFVLQGGDPTGVGSGSPGYTIKGEFKANGFENDLSHTRGVISMARGQSMNSAGGQFFIVLDDTHTSVLDGNYAGFGKVIEGMDVIENIENANLEVKNENYGILKTPLTISKTTVDTKGHTYKVNKISK